MPNAAACRPRRCAPFTASIGSVISRTCHRLGSRAEDTQGFPEEGAALEHGFPLYRLRADIPDVIGRVEYPDDRLDMDHSVGEPLASFRFSKIWPPMSAWSRTR